MGLPPKHFAIYITNQPNVPFEDVGSIRPHSIACPHPPKIDVLDLPLVCILELMSTLRFKHAVLDIHLSICAIVGTATMI